MLTYTGEKYLDCDETQLQQQQGKRFWTALQHRPYLSERVKGMVMVKQGVPYKDRGGMGGGGGGGQGVWAV